MQALSTFVDQICMPNSSACKNEEERTTLYVRNYVTLGIFSSLMVIRPILHVLFGIPVFNGAILYEIWGSILVGLILLGRSSPKLFHMISFMIMTLAGPFILFYNRTFSRCTMCGVLIYPTYVFGVTRKRSLLLASVLWQLIILKYFYYPYILESFKMDDATVLSQLFVSSVMYSSVVTLFVNYFANRTVQNVTQQIAVLKSAEEVAQRQMNYLRTLSNEIRNPLYNVLGSIQSALFENLPPIAAGFLSTAEISGEHLLHMINNVLDYGRLEVGNLEIHACPTDVRDTIQRIWAISSTLLKRKDIKGFIKVSKNMPKSIMIDPYRLTQIMVNLVGNSVKMTEKGSITVSFRWIPRRLEIDDKCFEPVPYDSEDEGVFERDESNFHEEEFEFLQLNQKYLRDGRSMATQLEASSAGILKIVVKDTGHGIKEENLGNIFQKFSQLETRLGEKKIGTGLELYITKELVKSMQGEIRVYSKYGIGSSFIICIPCQPAQIPFVVRSSTLPVLPEVYESLHDIRIMIVDADASNSKVFEKYLAQKRIQKVYTERTGLGAYERYKHAIAVGEPIDLILIDINMPIMAGKVACRKIREYEKQYKLKPCIIIVITGSCLESEMNECLDPKGEIRAYQFLRKPIRYEELSSSIDWVIEKMV